MEFTVTMHRGVSNQKIKANWFFSCKWLCGDMDAACVGLGDVAVAIAPCKRGENVANCVVWAT